MRFGAKFGVDLPPDPSGLTRLAVTVEALGFDSFWVGDHVVIPRAIDRSAHHAQVGGGGGVAFADRTDSDVLDSILALTYLAPQVDRIALGLSVLVVPYRHPVVCAKMLATLDVFSRGRLIVGAGVGWMEEEFVALGADYAARGQRTDEYLEVMIELWTQQEPQYAGQTVSVSDIAFLPKPVQEPHPPLWIGGNGPPAMRRAARLGQAWMPNFVTPEELTTKLATVDELLERNGREPGSLTTAVGCRFRFDDAAPVRDRPLFTGTAQAMIDDVRRFEDAGADQLVMLGAPVRDVDALVGPLDRFMNEVVSAL